MHEYAHHPQPKIRQCPQCLKIYAICTKAKTKVREHLDDEHMCGPEVASRDLILHGKTNLTKNKLKFTNKIIKSNKEKRKICTQLGKQTLKICKPGPRE